jgi:hypothetical protein
MFSIQTETKLFLFAPKIENHLFIFICTYVYNYFYSLHRSVNVTVSRRFAWLVGYQLLVRSSTNCIPLMVVISADILLAVRHPCISCLQVGRVHWYLISI